MLSHMCVLGNFSHDQVNVCPHQQRGALQAGAEFGGYYVGV